MKYRIGTVNKGIGPDTLLKVAAVIFLFIPTARADSPEGFSMIPAGTFTMGSPADEPGRWENETHHTVTLTRAFYLQQTEVTKAQWDNVRAEGVARGYIDLPYGRNGYFGDESGTHPVMEVSWYGAVKWLNLKSELDGLTPCYTVGGFTYKTGQSTPQCDFNANGYRLPTEAEWEYACRAGTTTAFYSGPITTESGSTPLDPNLDLIGWYSGNSDAKTHPVGGKQANAWGLFDMSGNVYEWCWDWYDTYPDTVDDPTGAASGTSRVFRGGYFNYDARNCRSAYRYAYSPESFSNSIGFRPAQTVPAMWGRYLITDGYADTTPWMGRMAVNFAPWVWCVDLNKWLYVPDSSAGAGEGWIYAPN